MTNGRNIPHPIGIISTSVQIHNQLQKTSTNVAFTGVKMCIFLFKETSHHTKHAYLSMMGGHQSSIHVNVFVLHIHINVDSKIPSIHVRVPVHV